MTVRVPSTPCAQEKQPVAPPKHGSFDDLFSVFKSHQHPIVLVEEFAMAWMGLRVSPNEDLDLLIRDSAIEALKADILATGQYELVEQNLRLRLDDVYTKQVPRLRLRAQDNTHYSCISLWSESVYGLKVDYDNDDDEKIEVPDPLAWNSCLMEERWDLDLSWAGAEPVGYTKRIADGVQILPPILAQSTDAKCPIYIAKLPRMLDALLGQASYRRLHLKDFGDRPSYHLRNFVRYLHLEKPQQRERILSAVAEQNRSAMMHHIDKFKRKPLLTLQTLKVGTSSQ